MTAQQAARQRRKVAEAVNRLRKQYGETIMSGCVRGDDFCVYVREATSHLVMADIQWSADLMLPYHAVVVPLNIY